MDELDKIINKLIKLKECCEWNGYDFFKVPAYKELKKEIITQSNTKEKK